MATNETTQQSRFYRISTSREFRIAIILCISIAILNGLILAYKIGYSDGENSGRIYVPIHQDRSYEWIRLKIEVGLIVMTLGLSLRRVIGVLLALFVTVLIGIQYLLWYLDTERWLRDVRLTDLSQAAEFPHFAGIYQAKPWDVAVLALVTAVVIWLLRVLFAIILDLRSGQAAEVNSTP